ncbi:MAG: EAL domain-containing protein [Pseudomonadota bacterium]
MTGTPDPASHQALVLVVDDDDMERILIREALENAGFLVEEAVNGVDGVKATEAHRPDLVFLDVFMPEMDGFDSCSAIRKLPGGEHLPILMVTGADDTESIKRAYDVGATDFMAKPINWPLLGHRVRYLYRASEAFRQSVESQAELAEAQRIAQLGSWKLDALTSHLECSHEALRILAWDDPSQLNHLQILLDHIHPDDQQKVRSAIDDATEAESRLDLDFRLVRPDSSIRCITARAQPVDSSASRSIVFKGTFQDITERKRTEAELHHLAHHDSLTDLPNRVLFQERLEHALARSARDQTLVAVHCLDLDHFKDVNDTLGHAFGDRLLQDVAERLLGQVRGADTVARLGGDEFAVIQCQIKDPQHPKKLSDRLVECVSRPFHIDGHEILISASIGITLYPDDAADAEQLLVKADIAMYRAKAKGRNGSCFFVAGMDEAIRQRKDLERDLRLGLEEGWFEIHYQPQITADNGAMIGAEALLRMRHPERGLLSPQDFIPLAEDTGLIVPIGSWILRTACAQAAAWHAEGNFLRVAVNLSPMQFRQAGLVTTVRTALHEANLAPEYLELEITESMLMHDTANAVEVLQQLRHLGVNIAMDDFGTGYSSLSYLKLFPFDRIKIDRSFVRELADDQEAAVIVKAIVALGHSLNMQTTAEGVETPAQLSYLKNESCDEIQGYYFGRPMAADQFNRMLHATEAGVATPQSR